MREGVMTELKTKPSLLEALHKASRRDLTADEIRQQRVSFIMGSVKSDEITRAKIQNVLDKQEGRKAD
jgi:hypothetical protein